VPRTTSRAEGSLIPPSPSTDDEMLQHAASWGHAKGGGAHATQTRDELHASPRRREPHRGHPRSDGHSQRHTLNASDRLCSALHLTSVATEGWLYISLKKKRKDCDLWRGSEVRLPCKGVSAETLNGLPYLRNTHATCMMQLEKGHVS
jgi:hypothetical protein